MPKKKQVTFQSSIQGKFIPRNDLPSGSVFRLGINNNRFNATMAQLLASSSSSSSTVNNENPFVSIKSPPENDEQATIEISESSIDSPNLHSKLLHRRIVTMIETLKKPNDDPSTLLSSPSPTERKYQPITFGQLRQGAVSTSLKTIIEDKTSSEETYRKTSHKRDSYPDITSKTLTNYQTNRERVYYSPSLEQLFEQQNVISQTIKEEETQTQTTKLTVDEILARYYSKVNSSTNTESHLPPPPYPNTSTGHYMQSSGPRWGTLHNNQPQISPPPPLVLNEQIESRPPPPSYSSSIASSRRTSLTVVNSNQHVIYPSASTSQLSIPENSSISHSNSVSSFASMITIPVTNNSTRPPPPRYKSPTSSSDHSPPRSSQPPKINVPPNNNSTAGFSRGFSRLLYGKESSKIRRQRQKRKAFSDPDKKSVEAVRRLVEKNRRLVTSQLNKIDKLSEDDDTETESSTTDKQNFRFFPRRRLQRQPESIEKHRESAKKAIVPANPLLKRRIPSFLRVYSQASSSNDVLLQWHLFNLPELESFNSMMTRLYKNENLARVQLYEIYRSALHSALSSKTDDETDATNTPL